MKIGVVFPQVEFPADPMAVREYTQAIEDMGYTHLHAYDHVLGANPERPGGWTGPYNYKNPFFEPFVLFSYLSGLTQKIEFVTGILILPQRQTALVAKQAATLDVFSGGRLRLGVGLGWNEVEYIALGENFHNRGKRLEEQVDVLRKLWTQPLVNYTGRWHTIPDAGVNPLPVQEPIPIWFGGKDDRMLKRMARLADGWMPNLYTYEQTRPLLDKLYEYLDEAGRDKSTFGIEPRLNMHLVKPDGWENFVRSWGEHCATHLMVNTMYCGYETPAAHLNALQRFAAVIGIQR